MIKYQDILESKMFKHMFMFSLIMCLPYICFGDLLSDEETDRVEQLVNTAIKEHGFEDTDIIDGCIDNGRYRNLYTIDRRCYVTPKQKQQHPFNAVVSLYDEDENNPYCTGTIVKDLKDGNLYIYTAAHCTEYDHSATINIRLQNGQTIKQLNPVAVELGGNYTDVAIYKIPQEHTKDMPFVTVDGMYSGYYDMVGYGSLSIMNDEQIHIAKETFAQALETLHKNIYDEEIWYQTLTTILPTDEKLKASFDCHLVDVVSLDDLKTDTEPETKCQNWVGDSGGSVFNQLGNLVAIHTKGYKSYISLKNDTYADTFLTGRESASDVQESLFHPEIKIHDIDGACWINSDKAAYVDSIVCKDLPNGSWELTIDNMIYKGKAQCSSISKATMLNIDKLNTSEHGIYCWCKDMDNNDWVFSEINYNTIEECEHQCTYKC